MAEKSEKKPRLQSVRGMNDILPDEAAFWDVLEILLAGLCKSYGYKPIRLPIVEPTSLFQRSIGEVTDVVEKEMYSFHSSGGDALSLRPEGTAGCVRAVIQHALAKQTTQRLYYMGPMFRHENPQAGRYRQFHQTGVEAFGFPGPDIDAEQILMTARLWRDLELEDDIRLQLNSLGQPGERQRHRADLVAYLEKHADRLDDDARRRLHSNPLRILDSKNPSMQEICARAPRLMDYLGEDSLAHFAGVQRILTAAGIPFEINPRLVRGLDYYNLTVFEWVTDSLGAQGTVCAGGRYDGLVEQLGGPPTPACGFALGMERLLALLSNTEFPESPPDVYLAHQGEEAAALAFWMAEMLRDEAIDVILHCGGGSFKAQMKRADTSGAQFAVIIGNDEAASGEVQIKALRDEAFGQQRFSARDAVDFLSEHIYSSDEPDEEGF
ncbi:MAG: histidine--tRNA ligase [Zoogloeaceae bacterium]|jgi:histidyl-tRNA synthetase|nr:histidine--tRNA ligase [Zoogloeaceae bacterium]